MASALCHGYVLLPRFHRHALAWCTVQQDVSHSICTDHAQSFGSQAVQRSPAARQRPVLTCAVRHLHCVVPVHFAGRHGTPAPVGGHAEGNVACGDELVAILQGGRLW